MQIKLGLPTLGDDQGVALSKGTDVEESIARKWGVFLQSEPVLR